MDKNRNVWEGWTPQAFIDAISIQYFNRMRFRPLKTKKEVAEWCADNQPYYKKQIPEVVAFFWADAKQTWKYSDLVVFD